MTYTVAIHMPKHYRPMTLAEIGRVKWGAILTVLDTHSGNVAQCHAIGDAKDSSVVVKFRGGHVETLGAANPDEQFVAVTYQLADDAEDPNNGLVVALRASNEIAKLKGRIRVLEEALKRQADALMGVPTREQYDAIMADVAQLQQDYRILHRVKAS